MTDIIDAAIEMLAIPPAEITDDMPKKEWEGFTSCWTVIRSKEGICSWALGDLVSEFVRTFGDERNSEGKTPLDLFSAEIGEQAKTLKQYRWVSEKFPSRVDRAYDNVTWSHFRAAAGTNEPMEWVKRASDESWSVAKLAEEIKNAHDQLSVSGGRPCTFCADVLPETGSLHVRRDGHKEGAFCRTECLLRYYMQVHKNEQAQIATPEN